MPPRLAASTMKTWQIFCAGFVAAIALWSFPLYQSAIAGVAAFAFIAFVAAGFWLRPRREVFYVRTTNWHLDAFGKLSCEHEQLAVRVEVVRLWLLFLPSSLIVEFLTITAAKGTLWTVGVFDWTGIGYWPLLFYAVPLVFVLPSAIWMGERRVLRDAEACSARSASVDRIWVSFTFNDSTGTVYPGHGLCFGLVRPPLLARLVLYALRNPEMSKIGMNLLFHQLVIIGHGLTELDEQTAARAHLAETIS